MSDSDQDQHFRFIGRRVKRADSPERLTGQVRFTSDLKLPELLHARLVRSPYAAARIVSVDRAVAEAAPGVTHVFTARDLPVANLQEATANRSIMLAVDRALYVGQPVAVVLGESEAAAEDGAAALEIEYEPAEATLDI